MAGVLRDASLAAAVTPAGLEACLDGLVRPGLVLVPIRHHSPVCARLVREAIAGCRPRAVLVEGPAAFTALIPLLLDAEAQPPFAIYVSWVGETGADAAGAGSGGPGGTGIGARGGAGGPPRHAAYFPFCNYSPELVALRAGSGVGAALRFIDLEYADQVRADRAEAAGVGATRAESLLAERHLGRSQFLQALARRTGCRDHNDLWDHLFEARVDVKSRSTAGAGDGAVVGDGVNPGCGLDTGWVARLREIAAWCYFARLDTPEAELEADGTLAREAAMLEAIRLEWGRVGADLDRPVLVVTGGFHTVALSAALGKEPVTSQLHGALEPTGTFNVQRPTLNVQRETINPQPVPGKGMGKVRSGGDTGAGLGTGDAGQGKRGRRTSLPAGGAPGAAGPAVQFLVRYGFEQLDALNGYAAGMPSPFYYEQLWQATEGGIVVRSGSGVGKGRGVRGGDGSLLTGSVAVNPGAPASLPATAVPKATHMPAGMPALPEGPDSRGVTGSSRNRTVATKGNRPASNVERSSPTYQPSTSSWAEVDPFTAVCAEVLVELGRLTRRKKLALALSPADAIAALDHARRLARMRGHPGPLREDLLDGVRSCFVKGGVEEDGGLVLALARQVMAGTAVGVVPAAAGIPPLVRDFQVSTMALKLRTSDSVERRVALDLYRRGADRRASRLFHRLGFLGIPFGTAAGGPDFVTGQGVERLHEHWDYRWTPKTESRLVESGVYGGTIEEAAANRLVEQVAGLEDCGQGRSAIAAVRLVVEACRMGLHRHTGRILELVAAQVAVDPSLGSLARALRELTLLWESREPLEAHGLTEIPALIGRGYERFCFLLHGLERVAPDAAFETLDAMILVHEHVQGGAVVTGAVAAAPDGAPDAELFFAPLAALLAAVRPPALLAGGAAGLLHGAGWIDGTGLRRLLSGFLDGAGREAGESVAFLTGLLRARRELAWQEPAVIEGVHGLIDRWSEEEFVERLPFLRLAFAELTPVETDRVAAVVARQLGVGTQSVTVSSALSEEEVLRALGLAAAVARGLREDGLGDWMEDMSGSRVSGAGRTGGRR